MTIIDEFSKVSLAWIDQWVFIVMKSGFMQTKYAFDWNILFKYTWIHKCRSKKSVSISIHDSCNQEISEFSLQWKSLMYQVFLMVNYMWHVHVLVNHPLYLFLHQITKQKKIVYQEVLRINPNVYIDIKNKISFWQAIVILNIEVFWFFSLILL